MNAPVDVIERRPSDNNAADTRLGIIDCDIHPSLRPGASVKEIEKRAGDWRFAQIQLGSKTSEPLGRRRYWPIFAAAQANDLSIGLHIGGTQSSAPSPSGWPQFYIEDHHVLVHSMQNQAATL